MGAGLHGGAGLTSHWMAPSGASLHMLSCISTVAPALASQWSPYGENLEPPPPSSPTDARWCVCARARVWMDGPIDDMLRVASARREALPMFGTPFDLSALHTPSRRRPPPSSS